MKFQFKYKDEFLVTNFKLRSSVSIICPIQKKYIKDSYWDYKNLNEHENEINMISKDHKKTVGKIKASYSDKIGDHIFSIYFRLLDIDDENIKKIYDSLVDDIKKINKTYLKKSITFKLQKEEVYFDSEKYNFNYVDILEEYIKNVGNIKKDFKQFEADCLNLENKIKHLFSLFDCEYTIFDLQKKEKSNIRREILSPIIKLSIENLNLTQKEAFFLKEIKNNNLTLNDLMIDLDKRNENEKFLSYVVYLPDCDKYSTQDKGVSFNISMAANFSTPILAQKFAQKQKIVDYLIIETEVKFNKVAINNSKLDIGKNLKTMISSKEKREIEKNLDIQDDKQYKKSKNKI